MEGSDSQGPQRRNQGKGSDKQIPTFERRGAGRDFRNRRTRGDTFSVNVFNQ